MEEEGEKNVLRGALTVESKLSRTLSSVRRLSRPALGKEQRSHIVMNWTYHSFVDYRHLAWPA